MVCEPVSNREGFLTEVMKSYSVIRQHTAPLLKAKKERDGMISIMMRLREENERLIAFSKEVVSQNDALSRKPCARCKELEALYAKAVAEITRRGSIIKSFEAKQKALLSEQFRTTRRF